MSVQRICTLYTLHPAGIYSFGEIYHARLTVLTHTHQDRSISHKSLSLDCVTYMQSEVEENLKKLIKYSMSVHEGNVATRP